MSESTFFWVKTPTSTVPYSDPIFLCEMDNRVKLFIKRKEMTFFFCLGLFIAIELKPRIQQKTEFDALDISIKHISLNPLPRGYIKMKRNYMPVQVLLFQHLSNGWLSHHFSALFQYFSRLSWQNIVLNWGFIKVSWAPTCFPLNRLFCKAIAIKMLSNLANRCEIFIVTQNDSRKITSL